MPIPLGLQIALQILLQVVLIMLNAVFACAEIAVIETKGPKLDKLADDGNKSAKRLKRLTENPAKFLATIQVAITLSGFLASAFAAENFSVYIVDALSGKLGPISDETIDTVSVILITVILSYFTLVFGELVPKRLAMKKAESIALGISGAINFIAVAFAPLVWLLTVSTNGVLKLLKIDPNAEEESVSEEDIRMLADAGSESGTIDADENEMIQNVFEFDDITVGEIVTHRTEMTVLKLEESDSDWEKTVRREIHSYYPICDGDIDHITGILNAEKYLRLPDRSRACVMRHAVTPPRFVANVMKADVLFREMKHDRSFIAVVVDEYGGTDGIVTLNDLIEQIVGDLDETEAESEISSLDGGYKLAGAADIGSFESLFDVECESESATVGGWVMEKLEKIPETNDVLVFENVRLTVTKADGKRVIELFAEQLPTESSGEDE